LTVPAIFRGPNARSLMHTSSEINESHWVNEEEPVEKYAPPTGFHPVMVGDVLGSRYRIIRKLGWGVYSTVWLVHNDRSAQFFANDYIILAHRKLSLAIIRMQV
jgi:serine/threonine protein kinase